jgi:hypothetical protein
MNKLSSAQLDQITQDAFKEELEKIALKIPFSAGMDIPHGNIANLIKDLTSSSRYNILDTMKFAPGVKGARKALAKDIVNKRKGIESDISTKVKATMAKGMRNMTLADAPAIAVAAATPIPGPEAAYIGTRVAASKTLDIAKKKGWLKPSQDLRPLAKRDPEQLKNIGEINKMRAFNEEIQKLDFQP